MGSKQKTRRQPRIESVQKDIKRDEHQQCANPSCRNVIAVWSKSKFCAICRSE